MPVPVLASRTCLLVCPGFELSAPSNVLHSLSCTTLELPVTVVYTVAMHALLVVLSCGNVLHYLFAPLLRLVFLPLSAAILACFARYSPSSLAGCTLLHVLLGAPHLLAPCSYSNCGTLST